MDTQKLYITAQSLSIPCDRRAMMPLSVYSPSAPVNPFAVP